MIGYNAPGRVAADAVEIHRDLGSSDAALRWNSRATAISPSDFTRRPAMTALATTHLQKGNLDHALEHGQRALSVLSRVQSNRINDYVTDVVRAMVPWLIDGVHQLVRAPIVLVWNRLNIHVSRRMRELVAERAWLTVFLLPAYSLDRNPVEWVTAHVKRSPANVAVMALDRLEALVRNRLKRLQYRPHALDGFAAGTGLTLHDLTITLTS
ncbi:transposase [Streptomyces sp. NPDC006173]|uniref:transposase n=1 Tax=Streptomyces sp. NPDC006173 TaxID=3155349 RepID=UPI0034080F1E